MRRRLVTPYSMDQKRYFSWHTGIRATDLYHAVAQHTAERIARETGKNVKGVGNGRPTFEDLQKKLGETDKEKLAAHLERLEKARPSGQCHSGPNAVARWGYELAEETRGLTANALHCKPRNVFFANSATCTAIPIFLAFLARYKNEIDALRHGYERLRQEMRGEEKYAMPPFFYFSDMSYPTIARYLFLHDEMRNEIVRIMTRQNYGYHSAPFQKIHHAFLVEQFIARRYGSYGSEPAIEVYPQPLSELEELLSRRITGSDRPGVLEGVGKEIDAVKKYFSRLSTDIVIMLEHMDRILGKEYTKQMIDRLRGIGEGALKKPPFIFLDGSHTFGVVDYDVTKLCEAYIAGSSKGLAAEPTTGIGYARDDIMASMEEAIARGRGGVLRSKDDRWSHYPEIAFQFSPETRLGIQTDDVEKTRYWISLPELASMNAALFDRAEEMTTRIGYKTYYTVLQFVDKLGGHTVESATGYSTGSWIVDQISSPLLLLNTHMRPPEVTGALKTEFERGFLRDMPNHLVIAIRERRMPAEKLVMKLGEKGYSVSGLPSDLAMNTGIDVEQLLRISFRHDVGQDVAGLLNAIFEAIYGPQPGCGYVQNENGLITYKHP